MRQIEHLREQLSRVLSIDLNDFGLEFQDEEWISHFLELNLRSMFQPVYDSQTGQWFGHEALLRAWTGQGEVVSASEAFNLAGDLAELVNLDRIARTLHVLNYLQIPESSRGKLFLNVHGKFIAGITRHGRVFEGILHAHSIPTRDVVIEIYEREVEDKGKLLEAAANYRERGYQVAINDFDWENSSLERLWPLSPEYVRIDQAIIRDARQSHNIRASLSELIGIIHDMGARPVLEGIETREELATARESGATLFQGPWFSRPASVLHWLNAPPRPQSLVRRAAL